MGMGRAGQTLGVVACVGCLVWAGFALGQVKGKREGRNEVEARWAQVRNLAAGEIAIAAAAPSPLGRIIAGLEGCVDAGESPLDAPHFCRVASPVTVTAAHWWGTTTKPTRAYIAFGPGSDAAESPLQALLALRLNAMTLVRDFEGAPAGFWESAEAERHYRSGDYTISVHEYRQAPTDASLLITVDISAR